MPNNRQTKGEMREDQVQDLRELDAIVQRVMKDNTSNLAGGSNPSEINSIYDEFSNLVRMDNYNFMKSKNSNMSSYTYIANSLVGGGAKPTSDSKSSATANIRNRVQMEELFQNGDSQAAAMFLSQSSDIFHICDEIESICAYLYQLDEAIEVLRDNVMNVEQQGINGLPFDIKFNSTNERCGEYVKIVEDAFKDTMMGRRLNAHVVPKALKFGRYYVMTLPYSEIGVKMLQSNTSQTKNIFNFGYQFGSYGTGVGIQENNDQGVTEAYTECISEIDTLLEGMYGDNDDLKFNGVTKTEYKSIIEDNIKGLFVCDNDAPPNITGINESVFGKMDDGLKNIVDRAIRTNNKKFDTGNMAMKNVKNEDKHITDATIDPDTITSIPGCFIKLCDPRTIIPIKVFDHVIGYYYFENYDYSRMGTSVTDILSNQLNFNDQNMVIDKIVGSVLRNLKYGDILNGDNDFKSLILNCILYAERRQNPIRIKFVPVEYVTEFATNCDENGNGQPVLLKSLIFGRLYVSMLLFMVTTLVTKSTDTEFYYLRDGLLSQTYEEQVADIIEQFRNSNVDISQIINGNLMHGNRAINKRYFMCTGTQEIKPFDMEIISGQQVDLHNDFLTDLKKMAIGATGIPSVALDYMDEVEFAQVLKNTNAKVMRRSNNIQEDFNGPLTELAKKITKYSKPNAIPANILDSIECRLRPSSTINNTTTGDELNNNVATVDSMIETYYKGQATETPPSMEFEKEEMRKRLIMEMTPNLPWGLIAQIADDVRADASLQRQLNKLKAAEAENEQ